jgi:hypothetical protein
MKRKNNLLQRILVDLTSGAGLLVGLYLFHVLLGERIDTGFVKFMAASVVFVFGVRAIIDLTLREYARET